MGNNFEKSIVGFRISSVYGIKGVVRGVKTPLIRTVHVHKGRLELSIQFYQ